MNDQPHKTPFADSMADAVDRMERGARMTLDNIEGDTTLSSAVFPAPFTQHLAHLLKSLMEAQKGAAATDTELNDVVMAVAKAIAFAGRSDRDIARDAEEYWANSGYDHHKVHIKQAMAVIQLGKVGP